MREPWLAGANIAAAVLVTMLAVGSTIAAYVYWKQTERLSIQAKALAAESACSEKVALDARWRALDAYTAQARAAKYSRRPGQRFDTLDAVRQATTLLDGLPATTEIAKRRDTLRDLAIAALALPDIRPAGTPFVPPKAVGTDQGVMLWDLASGLELPFLPIGKAWHVLFTSSGDLISSGFLGVSRWPIHLDAYSGKLTIGPPVPLRLPESGTSISADRACQVITVPALEHLYLAVSDKTFRIGPLDDCRSVSVSPDGRWAATGTHIEGRGGAQVWRVADLAKVADLPIDYGTGVQFSPDGKWLLTAHSPGALWEVDTWREVRKIAGTALTFSPDGRLLAVYDSNKVVRLVEVETGHSLAGFENLSSCTPASAAFSPDGSRLIVTTNDGPAIQIWDLSAIRKQLSGDGLDWNWSYAAWLTPVRGKSTSPSPTGKGLTH
jgi:hypothetical protein